MKVFAHRTSHVTQYRRCAKSLSLQLRVRIGGRQMRIVAARLSVKITNLIAAAATRLIVRRILRSVAAVRVPGLDQRLVHAEMLVAEQSRGACAAIELNRFHAITAPNKRLRLLLKVRWSQAGADRQRTNKRNSKLYSSCLTNTVSLRIAYTT